jgi:ribosomal protein S18 acetylase RimI-like enzyme
MAGRVIQGSFVGGHPRVAAYVVQPAPISGQAVQPKALLLPGPPVPAFAGRPQAVQGQGTDTSFHVDPRRLGLLSGGGKPLPDAVRGQMETTLAADFSAVRVHVGPQAERIGAVAFTIGNDLYFAPGRFQPDTVQGKQLLGHELAHVVQQRQGRVRNPTGAGVAVVTDRGLEAEADRLGVRAAAPTHVYPQTGATISPMFRQHRGKDGIRLEALVANRKVGQVEIVDPDSRTPSIVNLSVDPDFRRYRLGTDLMTRALQLTGRRGPAAVSLTARPAPGSISADSLTGLYGRLGFAVTGHDARGGSIMTKGGPVARRPNAGQDNCGCSDCLSNPADLHRVKALIDVKKSRMMAKLQAKATPGRSIAIQRALVDFRPVDDIPIKHAERFANAVERGMAIPDDCLQLFAELMLLAAQRKTALDVNLPAVSPHGTLGTGQGRAEGHEERTGKIVAKFIEDLLKRAAQMLGVPKFTNCAEALKALRAKGGGAATDTSAEKTEEKSTVYLEKVQEQARAKKENASRAKLPEREAAKAKAKVIKKQTKMTAYKQENCPKNPKRQGHVYVGGFCQYCRKPQ